MFTEQRLSVFTPPQFNLATNTILGTTQRWPIDRTWPIEEILIRVSYKATALTSTAVGSVTSTDQWDNVLNLISKINLSINDGRQPRSVIDSSGVRMLEYCSQVGLNLSPETWRQVQYSTQRGTAAVPTGTHQIFYRVPCADPCVGEGLRSRLYLPVHTMPQDPVLTLSFNTVAGMGLSVGSIDNVYVDIMLIRREVTKDSETLLQKTAGSNPNGYIDWDLIETPYTVPLSSSAEIRFALPTPGQYIGLLMTQYRGGSPMSKAVIDANLGDTVANGLGNETLWRLETGQVVKRQWRWCHLREMNSWTRTQNNIPTDTTVTGPISNIIPSRLNVSPDFMNAMADGGISATAFFRSPAVCYHGFLTDNVTGDNGNELGSLLDCNTPAQQGLKMEIIGTPASVATYPSVFTVMGRRLFGDLSRWQKF